MRRWVFLISGFLLGMALLLTVNAIFDLKFTKDGSYDILTGAIIEFFFLQFLLEFWHTKSQKLTKKHLDDHLDRIEKLIKENKPK